MATPKPQHDAPPCPKCNTNVVTPEAARRTFHDVTPHGAGVSLCVLYCPACGHTWSEKDQHVIVRAWWSMGAHQGAST